MYSYVLILIHTHIQLNLFDSLPERSVLPNIRVYVHT
jgi:hypothetical protein